MSKFENEKIEFLLKDGCNHCKPKREKLAKILCDFESRQLPRDVCLTLELTSDWLGENVWHLDKVNLTERLHEKVYEP